MYRINKIWGENAVGRDWVVEVTADTAKARADLQARFSSHLRVNQSFIDATKERLHLLPGEEIPAECIHNYLVARFGLVDDIETVEPDRAYYLVGYYAVHDGLDRYCAKIDTPLNLESVQRAVRLARQWPHRGIKFLEIHECEENANVVWRARPLTPEERA